MFSASTLGCKQQERKRKGVFKLLDNISKKTDGHYLLGSC